MNRNFKRLVIVSNRLPVVLTKEQDEIHCKTGEGGLVSALAPLLREHQGLWIGWPGSAELSEEEITSQMDKVVRDFGLSIAPISLTEEEIDLFYHGFSNEIIWPLFHDFTSECNFDPRYWLRYQQVNEKFAEKIIQNTQEGDFLWVHDYQLLLIAHELKKRNFPHPVSFFLHIPFPSPDLFLKIPWRFQLLKGLLDYHLIGFQTERDKKNFMQCVRKLLPGITVENRQGIHTYQLENHKVKVAVFPISIDFEGLSSEATKQEIAERAWYFHEKMPYEKIIFSLDRLDFTKGIPYRLLAIDHLLGKYPEIHRKICFLQVVVPSRTKIPKYQALKDEVDRLVGKINSKYTQEDWAPIKYMFRSLEHDELLSCYRASEIALVTPIKDGMNLVAKEYIASNIDRNGVLILSEFAGAAAQLQREALLVNPYDVEGVSETIYRALTLSENERRKRMQKMRRNVRKYNVFWWINSYLDAAQSKIPQEIISLEYQPTENEEK